MKVQGCQTYPSIYVPRPWGCRVCGSGVHSGCPVPSVLREAPGWFSDRFPGPSFLIKWVLPCRMPVSFSSVRAEVSHQTRAWWGSPVHPLMGSVAIYEPSLRPFPLPASAWLLMGPDDSISSAGINIRLQLAQRFWFRSLGSLSAGLCPAGAQWPAANVGLRTLGPSEEK